METSRCLEQPLRCMALRCHDVGAALSEKRKRRSRQSINYAVLQQDDNRSGKTAFILGLC